MRKTLPSPSRFKYEFEKFRKMFPWVTTFSTWNEANHCGEPVCHRPQLVAEYYRSIRRACPKCTILAAEVLDQPNMVSWVKAFIHQAGTQPRYWGLHNYLDANRMRTTGTRALLAATKGQIWFTETAGLVARKNVIPTTISFPENAHHAAQAVSWVFRRLAPLSRRITRVYLYQWNVAPGDVWDSGLINVHGTPRQGYWILRSYQDAALARAHKRADG